MFLSVLSADMVYAMDTDGDGRITLEDFKRFVRNTKISPRNLQEQPEQVQAKEQVKGRVLRIFNNTLWCCRCSIR
jgi:hypothetical protein